MAIAQLLGSQSVSMDSDAILVWNVCGLNSRVHHTVVMDMVAQERISLVCLQEMKLSVLDDSLVISICGTEFEYSFLHVVSTRGGNHCLVHFFMVGIAGGRVHAFPLLEAKSPGR
jgi:hypothetical protein